VQLVHTVAALDEYVPAAHAGHTVHPDAPQKEPAAQLAHWLHAPCVQDVPGRQYWQVEALPLEYEPGGQPMHPVAPVPE
jgi:hypothetical protein